MNVESHVFCLDTGVLVQETVLEMSLVWSRQCDFTVRRVPNRFQNFMSFRPVDDKVTSQLATGLRVSITELERNGELVTLTQVFEEASTAISWKKDIMGGRREEQEASNDKFSSK